MSIKFVKHDIDEFPELLVTCEKCKGEGCPKCCWTGKRSEWPFEENISEDTQEIAQEMLLLKDMGWSIQDIADEFSVTVSWVYFLCRRERIRQNLEGEI